MFLRKRLSLALLSVAFFCVGGASVFAEPEDHANLLLSMARSHSSHAQPEQSSCQQAKYAELGLDAQQESRIQSLRDAFYQRNQSVLDDLKANYNQLNVLKGSDNIDPEEIIALEARISTLRQNLKPQRQALREEIMALLTPEQQKKLNRLSFHHPK